MNYAHRVSRWGIGIAVVSLLFGAVLLAAPAQPRAFAKATTGDTLSLALTNGSTFVYGGNPAPRFLVTLVLASAPTVNRYMTASVTMDSGEVVGGILTQQGQNSTTYTASILALGTPITAGNRTATASYTDPGTNQTIYSPPISFTITKANSMMSCSLNVAGLVPPKQSLTFTMSFQSVPAPVDWQNSTYTIIFKGPTTVTYPNLTPSSSDTVTVNAPSQIGAYGEPLCQFNGSTNYNPNVGATAGQLITVSEMKQLGGIQLYSNPTTLVADQPADIYVKFIAGAGLPTPTGAFSLRLGQFYTDAMAIGPGGSLLVHFAAIPPLRGINQITVGYYGDPYYNSGGASFPLTNPPIPGNSGNPSSTPVPVSGTTTPGATTTTTTTPTSTNTAATPTVVVGAANTSQTVQGTGGQSGINWLLWVALAVIVVLGGAGGFFVLARRATKTRQLAAELDESALPDTGSFSQPNARPDSRRASYWGDDSE